MPDVYLSTILVCFRRVGLIGFMALRAHTTYVRTQSPRHTRYKETDNNEKTINKLLCTTLYHNWRGTAFTNTLVRHIQPSLIFAEATQQRQKTLPRTRTLPVSAARAISSNRRYNGLWHHAYFVLFSLPSNACGLSCSPSICPIHWVLVAHAVHTRSSPLRRLSMSIEKPCTRASRSSCVGRYR